ncbi:hypothetical protein KP509_32G027100 [Ceratopteris richardii]|uniref:Uncharacterized protein n=1 Tax=Ceratopteris richardii TaxID=49495 RepID=A0A8T2QU37_CERRI|nr:hypothetical protein KP509_32G027100 [Ceratopteris richardii]
MKPTSGTFTPPRSSLCPSAHSSSTPSAIVQKHVQMVSKAASQRLLYKFPDLSASGAAGVDEGDLSEFALVSCFNMGSCKQVHLGTQILQEQPARPSSARSESIDACTPLLTPQVSRSRSTIASLRRGKPRFKRAAHLPTVADKVMERFMQGASKCKYRLRLHIVAKRYKLRNLAEA